MNTALTFAQPLPSTGNRAAARGGFFQHHGFWAPGVRLFRKLNFRAKALIISAVLVAPLAFLMSELMSEKAESIAFSAKERSGVAYLHDALPLIRLGQNYRMEALQSQAKGMATAELAEARRALEAQMAKVEAAGLSSGATLDVAQAVKAVKVAAESAATASPDKLFEAHTAHVDAILALLTQATDSSNLTLDPDLDTYYLMAALLDSMPALLEAVSQQRGISAAIAASGKPATEDVQRMLTSATAGSRIFEARLSAALNKMYGVHDEYRKEFHADELATLVREYRGLVRSGSSDATTLIAHGNAVLDGLVDAQGKMLNHLDELLKVRLDQVSSQRQVTVLGVGLALLIGAYLFYSFFLVTQGGLNEVKRHLVAMTDGDLTTQPNPWGKDEAAALMLSLHDMQSSLRKIVTEVRGTSDSIVHASSEIAAASMDLSARTEQTAANLEESSASLDEISAMVQNTAENVRQAADVASSNSNAAARGGAVIEEVVRTMEAINTSSRQISDIIGTIDSIAFQTNILALNAAVEAARAGEQGRGFAVVASEVRSLAQRSAQAAKEIKTLINTSVEKVQTGTQVVAGAGETMQELVGNAQRINQLLTEISTAAAEQSTGIAQVGAAVNELDRMTQQNAALVEETAAASSALKDQAGSLATEVAAFRLPDGRGSH